MEIDCDKNGMKISEGDSVLVPEPNDDDIHSNEFQGTVKGFHGLYAIVEDMDGDCFDIEPIRLEIVG